MKLALIGAGGWGANHARALGKLCAAGVLEGLVICDLDPARAQAAAKDAGAEWSSSPDEVLRDPSVHLVDLVTPTPTHFDLARRALLAGKHVLVEKPMTTRPAEARELVAIAERAGLTLMPGHLFRYHPGSEAVRDLIAKGQLGELRYLTVARQAFRAPRPDMGVLPALAIHDLDLFCWLLGRDYPDNVSCSTASHHLPGIEEIAWLTLEFGAIKAHATESWVTPWSPKERLLAAYGERGAAVVDFQDWSKLTLYEHAYEPQGKNITLKPGAHRVLALSGLEPLRAELEDFLQCARTGAKPRADMRAGWRGVEMLEACFASAREGRAIALPPDARPAP